MAVVEILPSDDCYIYGYNTASSYATARSTATGVLNDGNYIAAGQRFFSGTRYIVYRSFLKFDTSALSGSTITQVNLRLSVFDDLTDAEFDTQIVKQDWSAQDPLVSGNMESAYDNCLSGTADSNIWRNSSGISEQATYDSGNLDTTWVNTAGNTYYSLRSSEDYNNSAPTGGEMLTFYARNYATEAYRPRLVVTYTEGGGGSSTPIHLIRTGMQPGMRIGL